MTPESLVQNVDTLFSFPKAAIRIQQLIDAPNTRAEEIAEVILCDVSLTARLLRLVNSPVYAPASPITDIAHAVRMLGTRPLRDLVFATSAVETFHALPADKFNMELFWFHAVASGIATRVLATERGLRHGERLFLVGLLHGLGKLVLFSQCADQCLDVIRIAGEDPSMEDMADAEGQVLGFNSADLGAALLKAWSFPESIWIPVKHYLRPDSAPSFKEEAELLWGGVKIATDMAAAEIKKDGKHSPEQIFQPEQIAEPLGLPTETIASLPMEIDLEVIAMLEILVPGCSLIL